MPDTVTILQSLGFPMCKTFLLNGDEVGYSNAKTFSADSCDVSSIFELSDLLKLLESQHTWLVIRGQLIDGLNPQQVLRRAYAEDDEPAYFKENLAGKHWVMFDFDKIENVGGYDDNDYRIEYLISLLPEFFHDVTYHYQWSNSAGRDDWQTLSAHIWFWLKHPRTDSQVRLWAEQLNEKAGRKIVDPAPFNCVQIHYTAAPLFEPGLEDPIGANRCGLVKKENDAVRIPLLIPPPQPKAVYSTMLSAKPSNAWERHLQNMGVSFHDPILKAIAAYVRSHGHNVNVEYLKSRIWEELAKHGNPRTCTARYIEDEVKRCQKKFKRK